MIVPIASSSNLIRLGLLLGHPSEDRLRRRIDQLPGTITVVKNEFGQITGRIRQPVKGLRARRHDQRVGDMLFVEVAQLLIGSRSRREEEK